MAINIISLNVRGLRDAKKRRTVFDFYRNRCNILCLQETHSTLADENIWEAEWGGRIFYSHGTNNARGVAILVPKSPKFKCENVHGDIAGRMLSIQVLCNETSMNLTNIYAPNNDCPTFFDKVFEDAVLNSDKVIVIGDYNTVMDVDLDRKKSSHINEKATKKIKEFMCRYSLEDVWRIQNPDCRRYSWYRGRTTDQLQASRLDYAVISKGITDTVHNSFYLKGVMSDHSAFFIGFNIEYHERGKSYWKLNCTLLHDVSFQLKIRDTIQQMVKSTAGCSPTVRWECVKKEIRKVSINYAREYARTDKIVISQLTEKVTEMENNLDKLTDEELEILNCSKIDLEEKLQKRVEGIMFSL